MTSGTAAVAAPTTTMTPWARVKAILGGSAGNLVEWYDWFAYSAFTLYFKDHFFPQGDPTAQLLSAAAIFAVGFLARPLGAWGMGFYADRYGRRAALVVCVVLMSIGSFAIALIPSYAAIGVLAPAALTLARLLQGLSVGGEYGASATYMSEMAGKERRGFWSSFQYVTLIGGQLLATLVLLLLQQLLTKDQLGEWGWRIPFAIGGLLAVIVFFVQSNLEESVSFAEVSAEDRARLDPAHMRWVLILLAVALAVCGVLFRLLGMGGLPYVIAVLVAWQVTFAVPLLRAHPWETLMVAGLTAAGSLSFYAYTTYMPKFLVNTAHFSKGDATLVSAGSLFVYMCFQPVMGSLSDRLGRKTTLIMAFGAGTLLTFPIFSAISHAGSVGTAFLLVTSLCLIHSGYSSVSAVVKSELFPTAVRAMGVSLPYAIANTIFGGTAEYVALEFKTEGLESGFYAYVAAIMAIALLISLRIRNTNVASRILED
jgi:MHS family alpha-ketoglutarate permease-like MFS transporter